jgi:cyclophilin family peptidyl-prolyl cis-trans isomerase
VPCCCRWLLLELSLWRVVRLGAQLLGAKYYDGTKFFEVLDGTKSGGVKTVQGGIQGNPAVGKPWRKKPIEDDPWPAAVPGLSNRKGTLALVPTPPGGGDADSARSTQFIIHLSDNGKAYDGGGGDDATGAALVPLGEVVSGLEVLETLLEQHSQQAEAAAAAAGETGSDGGGAMAAEDIQKIYEQGDRFLDRYNGDLAFIHSARYNKKFKKQADAKEL